MAGQPKKRAIIAELTKRAAELDEEGATILDYAEHWVASGKTITALAKSITAAQKITIEREQLSRFLNTIAPDAEARLARARATGAHAMVDEAAEIVENADTLERKAVPGAKLKVDGKLRIAAMFNRAEFGEQRGGNVTVNIASLHLGELRHKEIPSAIADAIDVPFEVVSAVPAISSASE